LSSKEKTAAKRILVVDDDEDVLSLLETWLSGGGYEVKTAASGEEALSQIGINQPNLVITDLFMNGMDGMELLTEIHRENPLLPVIMFSGQAQIPDAVKATHLGTLAFLTKPVKKDVLVEQVDKALRIASDPRTVDSFAENIIYRSRQMKEVVELAKLVADNDVTLFITGKTGTGKEVLAKVIHDASSRYEKRFIAINCSAIPEQLLESELFGHEKGAFTGANIRHEGLFQAANGGTLFLDEIGDMPLALQVKLLRVLQDFQVRPVGSTKPHPVDVRIISATHKDIDEAVKQGDFREDLYYRLKVVPLHIPELAERRDDIALLADHFLEKYASQNHKKKKHFAPDAMDYLVSMPWPGNVRQLVNVVDLCATLCSTDTIPLHLTKQALQDEPGRIQTLKEAKHAFERAYLISVLRITNGHVANAARIAGRNRTEFYKLLNLHKIDPTHFRIKKEDVKQ
jgi:two-component system response regulator GlrR